MSSTSGITLREVTEWVWDQAAYLTPTQMLVLAYLATNAFLTSDNPEDALPGQVYAGRSSLAKIQRGTGLANSTVRRILEELQDEGYVLANMLTGRGKSTINVFWSAEMDDIRADVRTGARRLPKWLQRTVKTTKNSIPEGPDATVLPFPNRSQEAH